jgi:small-conductance mechanosensitive channel
MTLVVANISAGLLNARLRNVSESAAASGIARTLVRGAVVVLGGLMVLHQLGVAIAPVLTALGVGGLAVALALQDTLGNLFAGIHILLEKPFAIGHFVRLEGGDEGWVQDIGWRTTRLLTLSDHTVVIPNAKIAGSKIVNMHLPDPIVRVERKLLVAYESDPARVERVLQEELDRAVAELPQAVPEPRPDVLLEAFADSGLQYTVRFYVKEIALERVSCSLVLTRIAERLRQEGIEVPYPHRVVELRGGLPGPA